MDGFYGRPRIDLNYLSKHSKGLICLTACIAGAIPKILLNRMLPDRYEQAKKYALELKSMFEEGDFYIELQNHHLDVEREVNPQLVKLAKEIGVKCVATNDVHYIKESDWKMHDVLLCIKPLPITTTRTDSVFLKEFYLKNYDQMFSIGLVPRAGQHLK